MFKFFVTSSIVILDVLENVFIRSNVERASLIAPSAFFDIK